MRVKLLPNVTKAALYKNLFDTYVTEHDNVGINIELCKNKPMLAAVKFGSDPRLIEVCFHTSHDDHLSLLLSDAYRYVKRVDNYGSAAKLAAQEKIELDMLEYKRAGGVITYLESEQAPNRLAQPAHKDLDFTRLNSVKG